MIKHLVLIDTPASEYSTGRTVGEWKREKGTGRGRKQYAQPGMIAFQRK